MNNYTYAMALAIFMYSMNVVGMERELGPTPPPPPSVRPDTGAVAIKPGGFNLTHPAIQRLLRVVPSDATVVKGEQAQHLSAFDQEEFRLHVQELLAGKPTAANTVELAAAFIAQSYAIDQARHAVKAQQELVEKVQDLEKTVKSLKQKIGAEGQKVDDSFMTALAILRLSPNIDPSTITDPHVEMAVTVAKMHARAVAAENERLKLKLQELEHSAKPQENE